MQREEQIIMKKTLIIVVICVLILSGFGAVALPNENQIEHNPLDTQDFDLEIVVKGGLFGYTVAVTLGGTEPESGNLTINITTDASIMILGKRFELIVPPEDIEPGETVEYKLRPVFGFGPATITITGAFYPPGDVYPFETEVNGFIVLFFVRCGATPIILP
jgi:hypothetical protein